jgi:hypothetical protein
MHRLSYDRYGAHDGDAGANGKVAFPDNLAAQDKRPAVMASVVPTLQVEIRLT